MALEGKVALVTGAGQGLGQGMALGLAIGILSGTLYAALPMLHQRHARLDHERLGQVGFDHAGRN